MQPTTVSTHSLPDAPGVPGRWKALGLLMALAFLNYFDRSLLPPVLPLIGKHFGASDQMLGALTTGFFVVYAFSAPLVGYLSDRMTRKTILLVSLVAWSLVTAASGLAMGMMSLLIWRSLTGLGEGGYFPTAASLIGDLFPPRERGRAFALHGLFTGLGGAAGLAAGGVLGHAFGWRAPFLMAIVPGLFLTWLVARTFQEPAREEATRGSGETGEQTPYLRIVLSRAVLLISLTAGAAAFSMWALNAFLPKFLVETRGMALDDAGVRTGIFFSLTIVGTMLGGFLSDRLSTRMTGARPLLVALPYLAVVPAALAMTRTESVLVTLLCYGATQLCRGFAEPNIYGTVVDAVPSRQRGTAQGFLLMLNFAGAAASPVIAGFIIDSHKTDKVAGYRAAIDLLAVGATLAGVLALALCLLVRARRPV